ncbi:hypothetical protein BDV29DRAFT_182019 [Aspergillus leporis]|uniref:DUF7770 domain-containing protein n=1 Tax=Aspergillus leporis TaxID=41062 RepID=A0A5N5WRM1_9EURO|nr:hypothetical protein BDV29DRAFT_182019 [Aspergillus leporis]
MSTIQYIPASLAASAASYPISCIYACAHPANPTGPPGTAAASKMTNHWVFHFVTNSNESLRLDPSPSGPNFSIVLIVTKKTYTYSHNAVKSVQISTRGLSFKTIIDLIHGKKYDKYQFAAGGQGCRFWVSSVIELLKNAGYIQNTAEFHAAISALQTVWGPNGQSLPASQQTPITQGTFFAPQ